MIAIWAYSIWETLGKPPKIKIVELGPGKGTLISDFLRIVAQIPEFFQAISFQFVEISPILRNLQEKAIKSVISNTNSIYFDQLMQHYFEMKLNLAFFFFPEKQNPFVSFQLIFCIH